MIPFKQWFRHRPEDGVYGDCRRAAFASIIGLPLADVPHFYHDGCDEPTASKREVDWLLTQRLVRIVTTFQGTLEQVLNYQKAMNPGTYYLLDGLSRNNVNHTVVCLDDAIVHDPALDESGIVGPCDNGFFYTIHLGSAIARHGLGSVMKGI